MLSRIIPGSKSFVSQFRGTRLTKLFEKTATYETMSVISSLDIPLSEERRKTPKSEQYVKGSTQIPGLSYDGSNRGCSGGCYDRSYCFNFTCPNNKYRDVFTSHCESRRYYSTNNNEKRSNSAFIVTDNGGKNPSGTSLSFDHTLTPLQQHFKRVTLTTGKFLGVTAVSGSATIGAALALASVASADVVFTFGACGIIASFAGSLYHAWQLGKPKPDSERLKHAYWMHGFMGVALSPSLLVFSQFIPHALITTGALVAGPITVAHRMPKGAMLPWGTALYTGLWGLIGVGVTSILAPIFGFHNVGMMLHNIDLYAGVALFTVYNAYDTHVMIDDFEKGDADYIGHSANYSLNAINIFIRMLEIFSKMNKKDE